jgi:hypothetical protein
LTDLAFELENNPTVTAACGFLTFQHPPIIEHFLQEEYKTREKRRIEYLMKMSGIHRIRILADFDWTFNPKIPRDKIMEFLQTEFLRKPSKLVLIGTAGVGQNSYRPALCHNHPQRPPDPLHLPLRLHLETFES